MASDDSHLAALRVVQVRAIAEFEEIQLKAQAKHAQTRAIANNSEIHDIFNAVFDSDKPAPTFAPAPFDVKCALLYTQPNPNYPNTYKISRYAGADTTTFPARVVVSKYQVVIGHEFKYQTDIEFDIDNYGNLLHVESGLYLIFNRAPFPAAAFRFLLFNNKQIFTYKKAPNKYWLEPTMLTQYNYINVATEQVFFNNAQEFIPENMHAIFVYMHKMRDALSTRVSAPPPLYDTPQHAAPQYDAQHQQIVLMRAEIVDLNNTIAKLKHELDGAKATIGRFKETQKMMRSIVPPEDDELQ